MAERTTDKEELETIIADVSSKMKNTNLDDSGAGDFTANSKPSKSSQDTGADFVDRNVMGRSESESNVKSDQDEEEDEDDLEIDEIYMKDVELNATDDEKENMRVQGQELKSEGNALFKEEKYQEALKVYTTALRTCPLSYSSDRSILYSNRAACLQHLEKREAVTEDCTKALELNPVYIKARLRRAQNFEALDKLDEAFEDYKKILETEPMHREASFACQELPARIQERNEKLKTEMLGKLKDLGNLVLRPFGLSTENFKMQQDPATGSYSINFQQ